MWVADVVMIGQHCYELWRSVATMVSSWPESLRIRGSGCQGVALGCTPHRNASISQCGEMPSGGLCESRFLSRCLTWAPILAPASRLLTTDERCQLHPGADSSASSETEGGFDADEHPMSTR